MPSAAFKPCYKAGCNALVSNGSYCDKHQTTKQDNDKQRGNANKRGYGHKWRVESAAYKKLNPLCVKCLEVGRIKPVSEVDHIVACKGDNELFWRRSNWQSLCKSCHSRKTATHDMGAWIPHKNK